MIDTIHMYTSTVHRRLTYLSAEYEKYFHRLEISQTITIKVLTRTTTTVLSVVVHKYSIKHYSVRLLFTKSYPTGRIYSSCAVESVTVHIRN